MPAAAVGGGDDNALAHSKMLAAKDEPIKRSMLAILSRIPVLRSLFDLKQTQLNTKPRHLYHQMDIPKEELSPKTGFPIAKYATNKIRTTKYTPLNFVPKNVLFQFQNVANIYFLAIAIFSAFSIFGVQNAGLAAVPIIAIVAVTAIRDAIEDYRRLLLDLDLNNTVTTVLANVPNLNSPKDDVDLWRRFKKMSTRGFRRCWFFMKGKQDPMRDGSALSAALELKRTQTNNTSHPRMSVETRRSIFSRATVKVPRFKKTYWKSIRVGDFVKIYANETVPADVLVVSSSDPEGECFIDTQSLDGETSLKERQAVQSLRQVRSPEDIDAAQFWLELQGANSDLQTFGWTLHHPEESGLESEALTMRNLVPRGCTVRNTHWMIGYVVYTGVESKIILNSGETPQKRSHISRELNWYVMFSFAALFILCFISGLVNGLKLRSKHNSAHFFEFGRVAGSAALTGFVDFFAAMVNLQNLIPISLYVSVEIVRTIQAYFIWSDVNLYDEETDYRCTPKSWGISDDLGQIEYIFSDKTGTLTQNKMRFRKCTINGKSYGIAFTEARAGALKWHQVDVDVEREKANRDIDEERQVMFHEMETGYQNPYVAPGHKPDIVSADIFSDIAGSAGIEQQRAIERFALCMTLCSTVIPETTRENWIRLNAESPDEAAIVSAARDFGYSLVATDKTSKTIDLRGTKITFKILATLLFTSDRKRMTVLVENEQGRVFAMVKGADSIIAKRLTAESRNSELFAQTMRQIDDYAEDGLRVLLLAYREIEPKFAQQWLERYHDANLSPDRETILTGVYDELETNLTLIGGTGVEDQLQLGVPDTIHTLSQAGIKLWVLTGDKVETAISTGFACKLLEQDMELVIVKHPEELTVALAEHKIVVSKESMKAAAADHSPASGKLALVVDGDSLSAIVSDRELREQFALFSKKCRSVICCRVSPSQKAAVVFTIKSLFDVTTLAVGDGANDVSMIQEADIGIGIAGVEGRQAAMSADYAIGQFRFLKRLILVHGRYSYNRVSELSLNILYKNFVFTLVLFWFSCFNDFDQTYYFDYTYIVLYLSVFTALPPVFLGILDQDLPDYMLLKYPQLYAHGILRKAFTRTRFIIYVIDGVYQSAIAYFFTYFIFWTGRFATMNGKDIANIPMMGTFSAHVAVFASNIVVLLNQWRWDWFCLAMNVLSSGLILFWTGIYSSFVASQAFYKTAHEIYSTLNFWACVLVSLTAALLPYFVKESVQKIWFPSDVDIIRERWRYPRLADQNNIEDDESAANDSGVNDFVGNETADSAQGEKIAEDQKVVPEKTK